MSESTTSAPPPSISLQLLGRVAVEEIELQELNAGDRRHLEHVDRDDLAPALAAPTRFAATSLQPPGAAPRSTTRPPGFSRRYLSSISISL